MKKLKTITSLALLVTILLSVCFIDVSAASPTNGIDFNNLNSYESNAQSLTIPSTYEATVYLPKDLSGRGGVIIGAYSGEKVPLFNFEVHNNGAPRIYINANDTAKTNYDIRFSDVNLCNGKLTHVAITVDHTTGTWSCYVDGNLKQTINKPAPTPFNFTSKIRFGGDLRSGNTQYFKGIIQKVALYSDVRSAAEIASDASSSKFDINNIYCAYDLSSNVLGDYPEAITCMAGGGPNFKYSVEYSEEWIKDYPEPENYAYSFAVVGDIQKLTFHYPSQLDTLYEWIRDNAESKKIKYVVGLGDITDTNSISEYKRVNQAYSKIDGVVPFSIIRGNHDRNLSSSRLYDTFITQELYGDEITGSYDSTMLNTYRIIQVGSIKYLFMNLDFLLKNEVISWADKVISENKDCHVIVSTHIYMTYNGDYYKLAGENGIGTKYNCENNGSTLWSKLLSRHETIVMLLCGHNPTDDIYCRKKRAINGNMVTEILIDPQTTDLNYGGTGLVAMFYFSEDGKNIDVRYYSTVKDAYFKPNNQFKITLDVPEIESAVTESSTNEETVTQTENTVTSEFFDNADNGCGGSITFAGAILILMLGVCAFVLNTRKKTYKI